MHPRLFLIFLFLFLITILGVNYIAETNFWYWKMRWLDNLMHFAGGVWLACLVVWWQYLRPAIPLQDFWILLAECIIFSIIIGLGWEIYEGFFRFIKEGNINEMSDTISDLVFDMMGGASVAIFMWTKIGRV